MVKLIAKEKTRTFIILFVLLVGVIPVTQSQSNPITNKVHSSTPSNVFIDDLLENPKFNEEPEVVVNGTSDEFSSSYHHGTGEDDPNYIELEWTHDAGTKLDYIGVDPEGIMPAYNDFVYTVQEFEWPYEQVPDDAEILLNYSTHRTGDFAEGAQELNYAMFRVYLWVIDSSNNWYLIYESRESVYPEYYSMHTFNFNYLEIINVFKGMVETDGVQEDPTDTARLVIGLAPTYRFESYLSTEPWTFYDGSVSIRVCYTDLFVRMDRPQDPDSIWQPLYNETYGITVGDVFPLSPNASDTVYDELRNMKVGPDGAVYVTGNSRSGYSLSIQGYRFSHQFLLKYDSKLNLLWEKKNENMTQVRSMYLQGGYIYTTGYIQHDDTGRDLIVTKWSASGEKIWQTEWGENFTQVGVGIGVLSNGTSYVVCSDYDQEGLPGYMNTSMLKFDGDGNLLWNRSMYGYFWTLYDESGEIYLFDEYFEFKSAWGWGGIYYYNGTEWWDNYAQAYALDGKGGYYTANQGEIHEEGATQIVLVHFDSLHHYDWHTNYSVVWPNGWYYSLKPVSMVVTPDDKIQLLVQHTTYTYEYLLLTYDLDGNLLANRSIGEEHWPLDS